VSNAKFGSISAILWLLNAGRYVNMSIYLYFTENMVMTRKIGFKSLIFQSVSMAMVLVSVDLIWSPLALISLI
jgi:hypothetical protein